MRETLQQRLNDILKYLNRATCDLRDIEDCTEGEPQSLASSAMDEVSYASELILQLKRECEDERPTRKN